LAQLLCSTCSFGKRHSVVCLLTLPFDSVNRVMKSLAASLLLAISAQGAENPPPLSFMKNDDPGSRILSNARIPSKVFARCEGPPVSFGVGDDGFLLTGLGAELKLSVNSVESNYLWTYDESGKRWVHGEGFTEMAFSASVVDMLDNHQWATTHKDVHVQISAHEAACTTGLKDTYKENRYRYDLSAPAEGNNTLAAEVRGWQVRGLNHVRTVRGDWLASVDRVQSVVLSFIKSTPGDHFQSGGKMIALGCCGLIPQMPTLPDNWAATIEANFLLPEENKMYTINRHEMYSTALDATRITSNSHDHSVVHIMRAGTSETYTLLSNSTFKKGVCEASTVGKFAERMTTKDHHLKSTAQLLMFEPANETYVGPGCPDCEVRGVPCEKWSHHMSSFRPGGASYTVSYFFMEVDWRTKKKETFHRHLMRVLLEGDHPDGSKVKHVYDFVDFNSIEPKAADFDQCRVFATMYPEGNSSACGCFGIPEAWAYGRLPQELACSGTSKNGRAAILYVFEALAFIALGVVLVLVGKFVADRAAGRASKHQMFEDEAEKPSPNASNAAGSGLRETAGRPQDIHLGWDDST